MCRFKSPTLLTLMYKKIFLCWPLISSQASLSVDGNFQTNCFHTTSRSGHICAEFCRLITGIACSSCFNCYGLAKLIGRMPVKWLDMKVTEGDFLEISSIRSIIKMKVLLSWQQIYKLQAWSQSAFPLSKTEIVSRFWSRGSTISMTQVRILSNVTAILNTIFSNFNNSCLFYCSSSSSMLTLSSSSSALLIDVGLLDWLWLDFKYLQSTISSICFWLISHYFRENSVLNLPLNFFDPSTLDSISQVIFSIS